MDESDKTRKWIAGQPSNRLPDCFFAKLEWHAERDRQADLHLTANFSVMTIRSKLLELHVGLRRGELLLRLEGGAAPHELRGLVAEMAKSVEAKRTTSASTRTTPTGGAELGAEIGAVPSKSKLSAKLAVGDESQFDNAVSDAFTHRISNVHSAGSESEPKWLFRRSPGEQVILGLLSQERLATVRADAAPLKAHAEFRAAHADIWIGRGDWQALSTTKQKVARLLIAKQLKLGESLSSQELSYG